THRAPRSFPTRRSSDLRNAAWPELFSAFVQSNGSIFRGFEPACRSSASACAPTGVVSAVGAATLSEAIRPSPLPACRAAQRAGRSEEHTSELQSRENLV